MTAWILRSTFLENYLSVVTPQEGFRQLIILEGNITALVKECDTFFTEYISLQVAPDAFDTQVS